MHEGQLLALLGCLAVVTSIAAQRTKPKPCNEFAKRCFPCSDDKTCQCGQKSVELFCNKTLGVLIMTDPIHKNKLVCDDNKEAHLYTASLPKKGCQISSRTRRCEEKTHYCRCAEDKEEITPTLSCQKPDVTTTMATCNPSPPSVEACSTLYNQFTSTTCSPSTKEECARLYHLSITDATTSPSSTESSYNITETSTTLTEEDCARLYPTCTPSLCFGLYDITSSIPPALTEEECSHLCPKCTNSANGNPNDLGNSREVGESEVLLSFETLHIKFKVLIVILALLNIVQFLSLIMCEISRSCESLDDNQEDEENKNKSRTYDEDDQGQREVQGVIYRSHSVKKSPENTNDKVDYENENDHIKPGGEYCEVDTHAEAANLKEVTNHSVSEGNGLKEIVVPVICENNQRSEDAYCEVVAKEESAIVLEVHYGNVMEKQGSVEIIENDNQQYENTAKITTDV